MGTIETFCDHKWCGQVAYALIYCSMAFQNAELKHIVVIFKEASYEDHIYFCHDLLSVIGSNDVLETSNDICFQGARSASSVPSIALRLNDLRTV